MVQTRVGLAAKCVVRCGRLQRTLKDGQADSRGKCRGVNRVEIGTCAVTPARLAARTRGSPGARLSQPVERTGNAKPAAVQHVQVNHRRTHVGMPDQLLHGPNVMTVLEQVSRKGVPEAVRSDALRDTARRAALATSRCTADSCR